MGDPVDGPFLVVTRDGRFVTCLGRGMRPTGLPVMTRARLDALSEKFASLRERMALAMHLTRGHERPCARLLRRLLVASDSVSREEWLAISAWEPMLQPAFLDLYLAMAKAILEQGPILRRLRHAKGKAEEALHDYWNLIHAAGHLLLLGTMGGEGEHFHLHTDGQPAARSALAFALSSTGITRFIIRGAWAAGRMGKQLLPAYKKALAEDVALLDLLDTIFCLVAMGRRRAALRAEIAKALRAAPRNATTPQAVRLRQGMGRTVELVCLTAAEYLDVDDEEIDQELLRYGRCILGEPETPLPEETPNDVIRAAALFHCRDGLTDGRAVIASLNLIAASARGAPEQFYLPHALAQAWHRPWEPADTLRLLEPMMLVEKTLRRPAVRKEVPGPNQPCSCGSGQKYKKCCGGAAQAR